jgi:hypothetical protein
LDELADFFTYKYLLSNFNKASGHDRRPLNKALPENKEVERVNSLVRLLAIKIKKGRRREYDIDTQ